MKAALCLGLLFLAACDGETERGYTATAGGARQEPYEAIPQGSVPVGAAAQVRRIAPPGPPVTPAMLRSGAAAYRGKCAPCHGLNGQGDGPVVEKGFPRPPPLTGGTPGDIITIITQGKGEMPDLSSEVPPAERWAIAYSVSAGADRGR